MKRVRFLILGLIISFMFQACGSSKPELHLYTWANYFKPGLIEEFEKEFDCRVIIDTFDSNRNMYAKLKAGASGYDLIVPSSYYIDLLKSQGLLKEINPLLIPNIKYIDRKLVEPIFEPNYRTAIPYMIGYTGLAHRKDKIKDFESTWNTWNVFANTEWKGRMTILDDIREAIGIALIYLGYSINTVDPQEIDQAADQVIEWKKNIAKFESEQYTNGIASAEYLVVQGYSGDVLQVSKENENVQFTFPKEGCPVNCDFLAIPKDATQISLAHSFINYMLEPEVAAANMEHIFFICPTPEAWQFLSEKTRNNPAFFPSQEIIDKSQPIKEVGDAIRLYFEAWNKIKGS